MGTRIPGTRIRPGIFGCRPGISDSVSYPYPRFNIRVIPVSVPINKIPVSVSKITSRFGTRIRYPFRVPVPFSSLTGDVCIRMGMRKIVKKIFVGTLKMILKVFLRRKIFGEISVEYLGSISGKNLKGITREIFVGYFEEDFGENIYHYILFVDINSQTNILN
jgi:hypothetical protein